MSIYSGCKQILKLAGMEYLHEELLSFFGERMVPTILTQHTLSSYATSEGQVANTINILCPTSDDMDTFGGLINCINKASCTQQMVKLKLLLQLATRYCISLLKSEYLHRPSIFNACTCGKFVPCLISILLNNSSTSYLHKEVTYNFTYIGAHILQNGHVL